MNLADRKLESQETDPSTLPDDLRKQLDNVKLGSRVTVKGEFSSFSDGTISLNRCWLVP